MVAISICLFLLNRWCFCYICNFLTCIHVSVCSKIVSDISRISPQGTYFIYDKINSTTPLSSQEMALQYSGIYLKRGNSCVKMMFTQTHCRLFTVKNPNWTGTMEKPALVRLHLFILCLDLCTHNICIESICVSQFDEHRMGAGCCWQSPVLLCVVVHPV